MESFRSEIVPENTPGEVKGSSPRQFVIELIETIAMALLLFLGINAVTARIRVESVSMQPTLYAGDFVIVYKIAYKLSEPGRGDIIVFRYPPDPDREPYIKRIIGLPKDIVSIENNTVKINGQPLNEPYISSPPTYEGTWIIPEDSLYVLGDNRNRSSDSHSWGMVPLENVVGKALVVYWPPENWQLLDPSTAIAAHP